MPTADPVSQGGTIQVNPGTSIDLALPVKRQVIAIFGDQNMGDQSGTGTSAFDRQ